ARTGADGQVHPEDGGDAGLARGPCEADRPVEAVPVGQRQRRLAELDSPGDQVLRGARAVPQREARRDVQMVEAHRLVPPLAGPNEVRAPVTGTGGSPSCPATTVSSEERRVG